MNIRLWTFQIHTAILELPRQQNFSRTSLESLLPDVEQHPRDCWMLHEYLVLLRPFYEVYVIVFSLSNCWCSALNTTNSVLKYHHLDLIRIYRFLCWSILHLQKKSANDIKNAWKRHDEFLSVFHVEPASTLRLLEIPEWILQIGFQVHIQKIHERLMIEHNRFFHRQGRSQRGRECSSCARGEKKCRIFIELRCRGVLIFGWYERAGCRLHI